MGKDKKKKTLKIKCDVICPVCGENHYPYTTKNGKQKRYKRSIKFYCMLFYPISLQILSFIQLFNLWTQVGSKSKLNKFLSNK